MTNLLLIAVAVLGILVLLMPLVVRLAYRVPRVTGQVRPEDLMLPGEAVWLDTENDKRLFGWFIPATTPDGPAPAIAVIHGWGGSSDQLLPLAPLFHEAGYALLLLDARNHGRSDSDSFSSMPRFAEDLGHGVDWLQRQPGIDPQRIFVLGHSVGAAAALLLASRRLDIAGVISIAAFAHPEEVMGRQLAALHLPRIPVGWLVLKYIEHAIRHRFDDIAPVNTIEKIQAPVLLVHGEADRLVPPGDMERIYAKRRDDRVERLCLPGAGHNPARAIARHGQRLLDFLGRAGGRA
ncbi:MAG TPA: alpha/beta fold hydrolase [Gammaproteobacteria bacterium]|nr:alpha/beta fold hydrolase [Gammaproteobacteria bacterium]